MTEENKDAEKDTYPDLGPGEYEVKLVRSAKGEEIQSFSFKKKPADKQNPTGQYL